MIRPGRAWLAALLFLSPFGCTGTETGNPPATDSSVQVGVLPPAPDFVAPTEVDAGAIERASELGVVHLSLARMDLVPAGSCDPLLGSADAFVPEAVAVDRPATGTFDAPAGTYCALRLWPTPAPSDPAVPPLLRGHTFVVHLETDAGVDYVTVVSDRTEPIVLFADGGSFTVAAGAETVTLLVDAAGALVERQFWTQPAEPDGSWFFDEAGDAAFLRLLESTPGLFRLFLGSPLPGAPASDGGIGGGAGGGAGGADMLGAQIASSSPP